MLDCGNIVFNGGLSCAEKIIPLWNGTGYVYYTNPKGQVMKTDVRQLANLHFICRVDLTGLTQPVNRWEHQDCTGRLYLSSFSGNTYVQNNFGMIIDFRIGQIPY